MVASYLAVVTLTIVFTAVFAGLVGSVNLQAIKADWPKHRCEIPAMLGAAYFKPEDDVREPNQFAKDNFSFCMSKLVDEVLKTAFAPLYGIAQQQVNAQESLTGPLNSVRGMIKTGMESFSEVMKDQYRRFSFLAIQASKTWKHLQFAMNRMSAIVLSIVYLGLSISATVQSLMDFTLNVILIFIGIMVAMIIILFFVLFPFIPLIVTVIGILVAAGLSGAAGMAGAFCVDPEALVILRDRSTKPLGTVKVGDELLGDGGSLNKVEGVLTADASAIPLVEIDGVQMSGSHRVFYRGEWILAKKHPEAHPLAQCIPRLVCLNTTQHKVYIVSKKGHLAVGDWEEVSTEAGRKAWIDIVHLKLNGGHHRIPSYPTAPPLVSPTVKVFKRDLGWVPITAVRIGDLIKSEGQFVKITGVYQGEIPTEELPSGNWISDGVWQRMRHWWSTAQGGVKATEHEPHHFVQGLFLTTESDMFTILSGDKEILVRDFTELGVANLESSYSMLDWYINKK